MTVTLTGPPPGRPARRTRRAGTRRLTTVRIPQLLGWRNHLTYYRSSPAALAALRQRVAEVCLNELLCFRSDPSRCQTALWPTFNSGRGLDVCKLSRSGAARLMLQGRAQPLRRGIRHPARSHLARGAVCQAGCRKAPKVMHADLVRCRIAGG